MKEIQLNRKNRISIFQEVLDVLRSGGVIVYPTETSYGLGGDFYNNDVIDQVYAIKQKDRNIPLPIIVPDMLSATSLVDFLPDAKRLAITYWPGPLTLVLPLRHNKLLDYPFDSIGLRVSSHPFVQDLTKLLSAPLIATSANISGKGGCYTPQQIRKSFNKLNVKPDLFINVGDLPKRKPSTVIKFNNHEPEIIRQGNIII